MKKSNTISHNIKIILNDLQLIGRGKNYCILKQYLVLANTMNFISIRREK